jgi:hypothetical protein
MPAPTYFRWPVLAALGLVPLLSARARAPEPPAANEPADGLERWRKLLPPGLGMEQVRKRLKGQPARTCRQIFAHRYLEQWLYERPAALRLEFDCLRGQRPTLSTVRPLHAGPVAPPP